MTLTLPDWLKYIPKIIPVLIFLTGLWIFLTNTKKQSHIYPNLEKLLAIYSVTNWKHPLQKTPHIQTEGDYSGEAGELGICHSADFDNSDTFYSGALFDCFLETREVYIAVEGTSIEAAKVPPNPDFWSSFNWKSLFGYDYRIEVNFDPALYDMLLEKARKNLQADCYDGSVEAFHTNGYLIQINNLTASEEGAVTFFALPSYTECNADGSTIQRNEWVWMLTNGDVLFAHDLERLVRITARKLNANGNDLFAAANDLETKWLNKDEEFANGLVNVLKEFPDLGELLAFLKKKPDL